ncbi:MAG: bifunctional diaminohydroxyphosphoribosylaminopyrimidine deaminase/5-amino-6-(5-phosphoribosylamino)uracil reductase RibD [Xanthomonadales bacterium]|nr:bifunctional diaminohydroxyphosphoribosylaminopyrimidine deaminase/5-amino-6-(5-phosphoribosylamino)uracil reductase RibD [Xanthomonadales bacterium]
MKKALKQAAKGVFTTGANPRVGCVIVKDGKILAKAFHQRVGEKHAEVLALEKAGYAAEGSTVYVTLEPCSHHGKNPPCADALIAAGVKKVVVCNNDPNPLVAGKGYLKLEQAGIEVITGVRFKKGQKLNPGFFKRMQTGLPWVRCKLAQSLDGRTAMANGESHWITGKEARQDVQYWRGRSQVIITGIETVLHDDCRLNVRPDELSKKYKKLPHDFANTQPLRIILDSQLRIPLDARILQQPESALVVTAVHDRIKGQQLMDMGIPVEFFPGIDGQVDLTKLLKYLGQLEINEVLIESGGKLAGSFLQQHLLDELLIYTAPVILGSNAKPLFKLNIEEMSARLHIKAESIKHYGNDWRLLATPQYK